MALINIVYPHTQVLGFAVHKADTSVIWSRFPLEGFDVYGYFDAYSYRGRQSGLDVLVTCEPLVVLPGEYNETVWQHFDYVLTFVDSLVEQGAKFRKFMPAVYDLPYTPEYTKVIDLTYVQPMPAKRNAICMINGNKSSHIPGELYSKRVEAARWFNDHSDLPFDVYGTPPFHQLPNYRGVLMPHSQKFITLAQYRYCLAFENMYHPFWSKGMLEKMPDCLMCGTVPIYLGCYNIEEYIPLQCYIDFRQFKDYAELDRFLHEISDTEYQTYLDSIRDWVSKGNLERHSVHRLYDKLLALADSTVSEAELAAKPWQPGLAPGHAHLQWRISQKPAIWSWKKMASVVPSEAILRGEFADNKAEYMFRQLNHMDISAEFGTEITGGKTTPVSSIVEFSDLKVGQRLKVEGTLGEDSMFVALKISIKAPEDEAVIEGCIQNVDYQKNTLRLLNREFVLPNGIVVKDSQRHIIGLKELKADDRVKLKGIYSEPKGFAAKTIKVEESKDIHLVELQGDINKIDQEKKTLNVVGFTIKVNENAMSFKFTSAAKPHVESAKRDFIKEYIKQGDIVFDVGAHIGKKTDVFLANGAKVICFEPQPDCVKVLHARHGNNSNVVIVGKGVADKTGQMQLAICSKASTISTFSDEWKKGRFVGYQWDKFIDVEVTTLDEAIQAYGYPQYVKCDTEGFENQVLRGLSRPVPYISFEFTIEFLDRAKECVALLQRLGYRDFNVALGEISHLAFPEWVSSETLFEFIERSEDKLLWGDIYAKFQPASPVNFQGGGL